MTAKEMLNKRKFNPDEPIFISESDAEDLMNEFALHIAKQAVRDSTESKIDEGFEHGRGHFSACMDILYRIKTLTQTNEDTEKR